MKVLPLVYLAMLSIAGCAHPQQAAYASLEGVASAALAAKSGFRSWDLAHQRAIGCPASAACAAYRNGPARADAVKADQAVTAALNGANALVQDSPKADPSLFVADAFKALTDLVSAITKAEVQ